MMPTTTETTILRGGEWLIQPSEADAVFTPERLTEEHRLIGRTAAGLRRQRSAAASSISSRPRTGRWRASWSSCGAGLGLLGVDVPEAYGGLGLDKVTSLVVSEKLARSASFGATFGAHANLTIVPLMLFGSEAQKQKYLPQAALRRADRRLRAERNRIRIRRARRPHQGDAAGRRQLPAQRREDVDHQRRLRRSVRDLLQGGRRSVHRAAGRARLGREERQGRAQDGPARLVDHRADLPGRQGAGGERAVGSRQGAQGRLQRAELRALQARRDVRRRRDRRDRRERASTPRPAASSASPIATFGAIKHKIGEMVVRTYAIESLLYRTAGLVDARIAATPHEANDGSAALAAFEEYAVEASIAKVAGSEALNYVLDENIQIHGGNGYVHDYPAERHVPRRARQPHLRRHQRDQPSADSGHADPARGQGRPGADSGGQGAAGRAARTAVDAAPPATATARSPTSCARSRRSRRRR